MPWQTSSECACSTPSLHPSLVGNPLIPHWHESCSPLNAEARSYSFFLPLLLCSGRKKAALLYVVTYAVSCATKHSSDYWMLMWGRLLGGVATSLLFSAFESWLVAEHFSKGFEEKWIGDTFSKVPAALAPPGKLAFPL